ncbi:hypothetical protein GCU67_00835 [Modestobacter muralis]|uniref:TNase-like domain-containing protein n=1 Tax=Modestobacter muralis TaxID=1608614 RepID=A0A6P0H1Y3_9ACTN|nr:thermonuclease family protein [Modestobacter muralis]NEK92722.1 hypothetical protein [Modestobacter muralis]NEN49489.1 hypothetical protein [Modestobacter muralis]
MLSKIGRSGGTMSLFAVVAAHKVAATVATASMLLGAGVVYDGLYGSAMATVTGVVDGDTIDVLYKGEVDRVRLLNVNTPETVDPDKPVECMGPEASDYLKSRLPAGTEVRLERDKETKDGYGRYLAAVFLGDELVNAEIARQGLGVAMSVAPNTKYLAPVQQAQVEAQQAGRGLYSSDVDCTVPAKVGQLEESATEVLAEQPTATATLASFDWHADDLGAVLATAVTLRQLLDGDTTAFPLLPHAGADVISLQARVRDASAELDQAVDTNTSARAAQQKRLDDAAEEAARKAAEEAARKAAEEAAREAAEEAAREAAQEAATRRAAEQSAAAAAEATRRSASAGSSTRSSTATKTAAPTQSSGGSSSGSSGYTGCRSYAPGGKSWTPIPCPSR